MKTFFTLTMLIFTAVIARAQLTNTKWQGKLKVPDETSVILDFKKDTVNMIIVDYDMVGESMTYSVNDSIITMKKTAGHSPCNVDDVFKVKYKIKDDKLFISNLTDPCDARVESWSTEPFIRVKQ